MDIQKKVTKYKNQIKVEEKMSDCHRINMAPASEYIEPIYYDCLKEIFEYEKKPVLFSQHLLFLDDRLKKGLEIYENKGIKELIKTEVDIRAIVKSNTEEEKEYDVVIKTWLPKKLIRYRYEIIEYLENLTVSCSCKDFIINGKYRQNCSLICPHIASVLWFLTQEDNLPKFLVTPKERGEDWYEKSKSEDLIKGLYGVSMKQFQQYLNILVLRDFKGIPTSLALSIHKEPNKGYEKLYPNKIQPTWITFTEPGDAEKIVKGLIDGYVEMLKSRGNSDEDIKKSIKSLFPNGEEELKKRIGLLQTEITKVNVEKMALEEKLHPNIKPKLPLWYKIKSWFFRWGKN